MINKAKKNLIKDFKEKGIKDRGPSPSDFVGKLNFGFWVGLLHADYRANLFWQNYGHQVFPNKGNIKLGEIYDLLCRIQKIRNRLYHYEPLWDTRKKFKDIASFCKILKELYELIIEIIGFMSLDYKELLNSHIFYFDLEMQDFEKKYQCP